jgi:ABC-2 type transport system ATP-binding protein
MFMFTAEPDQPALRRVRTMLVEVNHLTRTFGKFKAVDDISFSISAGEIVGLIGPNGAGKTTTVHMLLGLITQSSGTIRLFGNTLDEDREQILQKLNFTSPYVGFPPLLTVLENLMIFARLYNVPRPASRIIELLESFGIGRVKGKSVSLLSSGEYARVVLCKAFLNHPQLLLLDEPTAHLDPLSALEVRQVLLDLQRRLGTTILITSHNMCEVQRVCTRILFLSQGRIVASGTPLEVTHQVLREQRDAPALDEVFFEIAQRPKDEVT